MTNFLCFQHTYNGIEAAVFQDLKLIKEVYVDKKGASKYFVLLTQSLLKDCGCSLEDMHFMAANKGPGPFTTLRVVLSSVNGLGLATQKPLIGVDGLDAILQEYTKPKCTTVVLLDAYGKDVYFGIKFPQSTQALKGYQNIFVFLKDLQEKKEKSSNSNLNTYFIGNGAQKYQKEIISVFGEHALLDDSPNFIQNCSLSSVGKMAFESFKKQEGLTDQILPVYLKSIYT